MMKNILINSILLGSLALSLNADFIRDNTNLVVNDTKTGLMWQDDAVGRIMNWSTAITTCENLTLGGYSDWRLPNIRELKSITDRTRANPAISPNFIAIASDFYWSSTMNASDSSGAWGVGFKYGNVVWLNKASSYYVRCVRAGQ
jgi:hypothetical protein